LSETRRFVQCTPNFSEGRDATVVDKIVRAIANAAAVSVVDYSMDYDHNRSVVTFVGDPRDVLESAFSGAAEAVRLIDLNNHAGEHPRIGAVDVIPITPIREVTMGEAIDLSYDLGRRIADELQVPVYFYEESANHDHRKNLAAIRKGGYETLKQAGLTGDREPDLGPAAVHPTAGATVVGARGPLIAFNVNLGTNDIRVARKIAEQIRSARDRGLGMAGVKALGIYLRSRDVAQVSTNITKPDQVGVYDVFDFIRTRARELGVEAVESELIGAINLCGLVDAAASAMKLPDLTSGRVIESWLLKPGARGAGKGQS
jgi:glutamate formiminotransferase / 5-formyltetrahydrofolate cyclo-ligase